MTEHPIPAKGVTPELVESILAPVAEKADVGDHHWVHGGDEGQSYCEKCIRKAVAKTMREVRNRGEDPGNVCVDGGYDWPEGDGPAMCHTCGRVVGYTLLDYGVSAELDHYETYPPEWPLDPDDAFALSRVFAQFPDWSGAHGWRAAKLGFGIVWDSQNAARGDPWSAKNWVWPPTFGVQK